MLVELGKSQRMRNHTARKWHRYTARGDLSKLLYIVLLRRCFRRKVLMRLLASDAVHPVCERVTIVTRELLIVLFRETSVSRKHCFVIVTWVDRPKQHALRRVRFCAL
jgi:hypothetical protein